MKSKVSIFLLFLSLTAIGNNNSLALGRKTYAEIPFMQPVYVVKELPNGEVRLEQKYFMDVKFDEKVLKIERFDNVSFSEEIIVP
jgi:hypothetical protein